MSIIGLDIDQSGAKGAAFSREGKLLASAIREYNMVFPQEGWVEIDAVQMKEKIFELLKEINSRIRYDPAESLSICTFGEGFVPVNEHGDIIYNMICPSDRFTPSVNNVFSRFILGYIMICIKCRFNVFYSD